jgi:hypothetical protein
MKDGVKRDFSFFLALPLPRNRALICPLVRFLNPVSTSFSAKQSRLAPFKTLEEPLNFP